MKRISNMGLKHGIVAIAFGVLSMGSGAVAFEVSGVITDSNGDPIPGIRVDVWDEDLVINDHLGTTYADGAGNYTVTVTSGWGVENPDVFITSDWRFQLLPANLYNNGHVKLVEKTAVEHCGTDPSAVPFVSKEGAVFNDHNPADDLQADLQMNQFLQNVDQLVQHINEALDYYRLNKGTVSWSWGRDVLVKVRTVGIGSFFCQNNQTVYIAEPDITGVNGGFVSDIYHEMGHMVHYYVNGESLPVSGYAQSHNEGTESDPPFAILEGWPSFVAELTSDACGMDGKYESGRDPLCVLWRGGLASCPPGSPCDPGYAAPTGKDGDVYESGEDVEGAVSGFFFGIYNLYGFSDIFRVMVEDTPDNIFQIFDGYIDDVQTGYDRTEAVYAQLQKHGIIYFRSRFEGSPPFLAGDPPDYTPPSHGNYKQIEGYQFLRGTVTNKFQELDTADLGVDQKRTIFCVRVACRTASDSNTDDPTAVSKFSPSALFDDREVALNTTILDDGDWDLLLQSKDTDVGKECFLPSWQNDGNSDVDTDEKYLKVLGTWFDLDKDPTSVKDGKVIVDNTAPTVSSFKPL